MTAKKTARKTVKRKPSDPKKHTPAGAHATLEDRVTRLESALNQHILVYNQNAQKIVEWSKSLRMPTCLELSGDINSTSSVSNSDHDIAHAASILTEHGRRLDALEARAQFRDASHDEPVSNATNAIGCCDADLCGEISSRKWWQIWRRT
ncbi:MAG: hypothetical protein KGL35_00945 [Bradyrhizobium sp.]|nr:hypothetical protein [Bradyrhizobium sp.]